jgi:hypothetical protein
MKPRLNSLAWISSVTFVGNLAPSLRWNTVVAESCCGDVFLRQVWETSQDRGKNERSKVQRDAWWRLGRSFTFQQDNDPKHTAKTMQKGLRVKSLHVLEWPSQSMLDPDLTSLERPEISCTVLWAIQPDRAWEDLQRRMGETPQIQVCQACSIIPKKTWGCNRCQRCFNKVLSKRSEYLRKCKMSVFNFLIS